MTPITTTLPERRHPADGSRRAAEVDPGRALALTARGPSRGSRQPLELPRQGAAPCHICGDERERRHAHVRSDHLGIRIAPIRLSPVAADRELVVGSPVVLVRVLGQAGKAGMDSRRLEPSGTPEERGADPLAIGRLGHDREVVERQHQAVVRGADRLEQRAILLRGSGGPEPHVQRDHRRAVLAQPIQHGGVTRSRKPPGAVGIKAGKGLVVDRDHHEPRIGDARAAHGEAEVDRAQLEPLHRLWIPQVEREREGDGRESDHGRG
jgi:hypothetical protein